MARCFVGKYYIWYVWRNNDGSAAGTGRAEVDFGSAPGTAAASVAVTGLGSIAASGSAKAEAWIDTDEATSDSKSAAQVREHAKYLRVSTGSITSTTGFTVYVKGEEAGEVTPPEGVQTSSGTTINTNVDTTIYTVPSAPTGRSKFIVTGIVGIVTQALAAGSGSPNFALTVGKTAGGTGFLTSQTVNTSTATATKWGLTLSQLGSEFVSTDGYNATLAAADSIIVRQAVANTGTISTACLIKWVVTGFWI